MLTQVASYGIVVLDPPQPSGIRGEETLKAFKAPLGKGEKGGSGL
jgi:hypothetical protein